METKNVEYKASVDTLAEAWSMIMSHTEEFERPSICIHPELYFDEDAEDSEASGYFVSIQGDVTIE